MDSRGRRDFVCGSSLSRGGIKLTITGNLGDVMKESAMLAMEYIRSHAEELDIDPEVFENWNTHIHVPRSYSQRWAFGRNNDDHFAGLGYHNESETNLAMT